MTTTIEKLGPRDRRITRHIRAIAESGTDVEKFAASLRAMRDDPSLTRAMREAIYKTLAQEAAQAYYVFVTGQQLTPEVVFGEALPELPDMSSA